MFLSDSRSKLGDQYQTVENWIYFPLFSYKFSNVDSLDFLVSYVKVIFYVVQ